MERHTVQLKGLAALPAPFMSVKKTMVLIDWRHSMSARWFEVGGWMKMFHAGWAVPSPVPMSSFLTRLSRLAVIEVRM